jgi:hydroxyacylglutathione hydrolase
LPTGTPITAQGKSKIDVDVLFSGDLLFAGSIGRTDLPGGDYPTILRSLARVCLTLPDETVVLSGHGPQTTIGAERLANPFLADLTPEAGPSRGL